jgi:multidrug resistance efflux pump
VPKPPSEKTQLAAARREIRRLTDEWKRASASVAEYRARATKAEQELAEWKRRFDLLLSRTPQLSAGEKHEQG